MSKTKLTLLSAILLAGTHSVPAASAAHAESGKHSGQPRYVLFDIGSFGGGFSTFCYPNCRQLNSHGEAVGLDATPLPDPFAPICFYDCHVDHAFAWKNGGTNDLGALQYGLSSWSQGINDKGMSAGLSQNGAVDSETGIFEADAVLWQGHKITDLGTLGGTQSSAWMVNSAGRVVAVSSTSDATDPFVNVPMANCKWLPLYGPNCGGADFGSNALFVPVTTASHAATWTKPGKLSDLGTLGGPDSAALDINDAGQIVGWSYVNYQAGASGVPDTHPFVWQNGTMTDLGNALGGTFAAATQINKDGQIAGVANTTGDAEVHAVVWDSSHVLHDRGTLGSDYAHPDWMNDNGDIVGFSRTADQLGRAFVYWHDGNQMINLGTIGDDPESEATGINKNDVIVGITFDRDVGDLKGWVSYQGGTITDLNTLIRKSHGFHISSANAINDRGVIAAQGDLKNGEHHALILVPESDSATMTQMNALTRSISARSESSGGLYSGTLPRVDCTAPRRLRPHYCTGG